MGRERQQASQLAPPRRFVRGPQARTRVDAKQLGDGSGMARIRPPIIGESPVRRYGRACSAIAVAPDTAEERDDVSWAAGVPRVRRPPCGMAVSAMTAAPRGQTTCRSPARFVTSG
ncbi:MAG: hypothetical protein EHM77_02235 [Planctomycetaceae bacterium]|nr:MAG: hypothetical protein EHM77_02235 [Planctomycetaceae bacterium]